MNLINFGGKYKPTDSELGVTLLRRGTSYSGVQCLGGPGLFTPGDNLLRDSPVRLHDDSEEPAAVLWKPERKFQLSCRSTSSQFPDWL